MKLFIWWQRWFASMIKTKGWWILPCQPHTGKITFIPHNEVRFGVEVRQGRIPRQVFSPLFERNPAKTSAPELHQFFINFSSPQGVGRDGRSSPQVGQSPATLGEPPHLLGREKGFLWNTDSRLLMIKYCVTFSLPCWKGMTRTKEFAPWMMEVVSVKTRAFLTETSQMFYHKKKKIWSCLQFSSELSFLSTKQNGNYKRNNLKKN